MSTGQASDTICRQKQAIIDRWAAKVYDEIPDARERKRPIIVNGVPDLLDAMINALASDDAREVIHRSQEHGRNRANYTNFTVDQIVREYRLLKETIFAVTDEEEIQLLPRERDGILYAIDQAVEQATKVFAEIFTEKNQQAIEKAEELIKELETRDGLRDQFIANLSHDIRTPLGNTQQLAELLEERLASLDDTFVGKLIKGIKMSAEQGSNLINTLMDVNLIQSGNPLPIQKQYSDLLIAVSRCMESLKPALRERINLDSSQKQIMGYWDASMLCRAINNLVSNAVKYGALEGNIDVSFRQDEHYTTVRVHNTGNPVPPEKLGKLFELYYRTQDVKAKGWGLGLTLVKGIVELHQGSIDVKSDDQEGTTFTVRVPNRS